MSGVNYYQLHEASNAFLALDNEVRQYMLNSREDENDVSFYICFNVNDRDSGYFDNNYAIKTYVFAIRIKKAQLRVKVVTKEIPPEDNNGISGERYESSKYYGENNRNVEYKFDFEFSGWASGDAVLLPENKDSYLRVDWERGHIETYSSAGNDYYIYAKAAENTLQFDNYTMLFEDWTPFKILRRQVTLYFESQREYVGDKIEPTIIRKGFNGENLDENTPGNQDMLESYRRKCLGIFYTSNLGAEDHYTFWYTTVDNPTKKNYGALPANGLSESVIYSSNFIGQFNRAFDADSVVCDVGYYLFEVSFPESTNYLGMETTYYIFEITKAPLTLQFWDVDTSQAARGYAEKVYDKSTTDYPLFNVKYSGFVGYDDTPANNSVQKIMYYRTSDGVSTGIKGIGLVNPYYVFVDGSTGKELVGNYLDDYFYPVDIVKDTNGNVVPYYIKLFVNDSYGIADNYYITIEYIKDDAQKILYPIMEIKPRPVVVTYDSTKDKITKTYDGTTKVVSKSVSGANYVFAPLPNDEKSGLITGDVILLDVDYNYSRYSRKDVYEQVVDPNTGEITYVKSDIVVTIIAGDQLLGEQRNNYKLVWEDENNKKIELLGTINQAKATVQFYSDETYSSQARSRITVTYDGDRQPVYKKVFGVAVYNVLNEIVGYEEIGYTQRYYSEETMYDSDTLAPINCAEYIYELTIKNDTLANKNYLAETSWIRLVIGLADVTIVFGGDATQTYGDIGMGLTAVANGIGGYSEPQEVVYFSSYDPTESDYQKAFDGLIVNIGKANAGTYYARVIYQRTTNFRESYAYEEFTILPRETVYSYGKLSEEYPYTGTTPSIEFYITYEEERFVPSQLLYNVARNGEMVPYNYTIEDGVITNITNRYPANVGEYQVRPYEYAMSNFIINNSSTWIDFKIVKVDAVISVNNATILAGEDYRPTYSIVSSSTKEDIRPLLDGSVNLLYYDAVTGEKLTEKPTKAGTYKVVPDTIVSENYNVYSQWGTLVINNNEINASVVGQTDKSENSVTIVGSFGQDTKITVNEVQNVPDSDISRIFNSYKENDKKLDAYYLSNVFVFSIENYTYSGSSDTGFTIKITIPGLMLMLRRTGTAQNAAYAAEENIYVAVFYEDGSMEIVTATIVDDDSLSFETSSSHVKAVSVLTMEDPYAAEEANLDWLMYVLIGIGVLAVGLALLLVLKRNG
ncbi:MAG: hypothetical protein J5781_00810 [Clostridia bacterium]|nr:hypothetical protein [Clostridia bacterium]